MKKLLLYSLFICLLFNCSSRDEEIVETSVLPVKIIHKTSFFNNVNFIRTYQYNGNKLKSITTNRGDRLEYFYTGSLITSVNSFDKNSSLNATIKIDYENNRIKTLTRKFVFENNELIFNYTWVNENQVRIQNNRYLPSNTTAYTDVFLSNGNISKTIRYAKASNYDLEESRTYIYDSKNYPLKNVEGFSKIITSELDAAPIIAYTRVNNLLKYTHKEIVIKNGQSQENSNFTQELNSNFLYNDNGFPTKYFNYDDEDDILIEYNK